MVIPGEIEVDEMAADSLNASVRRSTSDSAPEASVLQDHSGVPTTCDDLSKSDRGYPVSMEQKNPKRDEIRKRLREKERHLTNMINHRSKSGKQREMLAQGKYSGSEPKQQHLVMMEGKEDADRREAVRVLSQAALQMKEKLKKQKEETTSAQKELRSLEKLLNSNEQEKKQLLEKIQLLTQEREAQDAQVKELQMALRVVESKATTACASPPSQIPVRSNSGGPAHFHNQPSVAHEDTVWTQKDSMSKTEQIEYFEYQLLSKNHEIDELKQELIKKLKRIVELEVDLEIHDDRFSTSMEGYTHSEGGSHRSLSQEGNQNASKELFYVSNTPQLDPRANSKKKSFKKLMSSFRKGRRESSGSIRSSTMTADELSGNATVDGLQNDLANLEARYKKDKYMSRMQIEQLKQENNDYLIKVLSLEKSLQQAEDSEGETQEPVQPENRVVESTLSSRMLEQQEKNYARVKAPDLDRDDIRKSQSLDIKTKLPNKVHFLEEKLETLENERVLHSKTIKELQAEVAALKEDKKKQGLADKLMLEKLELENQAQLVRVAALENELRASGSTFSTGLQVNAAAELEDKLRQNYSEVIRLRKEHEIKEKKIDALRGEIIDLRILRMQYEKAAQRSEQSPNLKLESITEDTVLNIHMQPQSRGGMIALPAPMPCDEIKR